MVYGTITDTATNCTWPSFTTFLSQTSYKPWDGWFQNKVDSLIDYMVANYDSKLSSGTVIDYK